MKFAKLSIAALAVVGFSSSAVALDMSGVTAKPYVKTKFYYETNSKDAQGSAGDTDFFAKGASSGQALVTAGITGGLDECWGYGFEYNVADTLGLENNIVSNTRMGEGRHSDGVTTTQDWASQAYVTYSACNTIFSNTTFKVGRQFLDTPLAYTEKWNLTKNSFDAIVLLNQDIKNVTLVGAYIGKGNGANLKVSNGDRFEAYGTTVTGLTKAKGAYAVGALTNLVEGLPINLWYYGLPSTAQAAWADAGYTLKVADDMSFGLGAQYGTVMPSNSTLDDTSGFGLKIGGKVSMFNVMAAYSKMSDKGAIGLGNTATMSNSTNGWKTKLYTQPIYSNAKYIAVAGSEAYKVKAAVNFDGIGKVIAQYMVNENSNDNKLDVSELNLILATKLAGIGAKLIYSNIDHDQAAVTDKQVIRAILSKDF
jgi:hypothetical protein